MGLVIARHGGPPPGPHVNRSKTYVIVLHCIVLFLSGMRVRIRIRSDPLIFGLPDPDPTCNNGYINNYFHLEQNINHNQQIQATTIDLTDEIFPFRIILKYMQNFLLVDCCRIRGKKIRILIPGFFYVVFRIRFILIRILLQIRPINNRENIKKIYFFFYKKYISPKYDLFCYLWGKYLCQ